MVYYEKAMAAILFWNGHTLTDPWIGSIKRDHPQYNSLKITVIICPVAGPGDL